MDDDIDTGLPDLGEVWHKTLGWEPNQLQLRQFQQVYQQIKLGNRQLNLTRIIAPGDFWEKHLWDSLASVFSMSQSGGDWQVIDIGTGAGFPGLPVAIAFPSYTVTLLDSTRKKVFFLDSLIKDLGLTNVNTLIGRAEAIGKQKLYRSSYDLALIRAVGTASVCAEYAIPFLKNGGLAILYRGHWTNEDTELLAVTAAKLGSAIAEIKAFTTPLSDSIRHCIYLRKNIS